jgi:hypothetical protein
MAKVGGKGRGWLGWALGVLAALTLVLATPEHVLDFDEAAGPAAELAVHGPVRTLIDHGAPGHACAAHCAAHVMAEIAAPFVVAPPSVRPLILAAAEDRPGRAHAPALPDRPPKA